MNIQKVRVSSYKDYIALDIMDKEQKILATPFYIKNGTEVEVHWAKPSNERPDNPCGLDDWYDRYMFRMKEGKLFTAWLNGPCFTPNYTEESPQDLIGWRFQFARRVLPATKIKLN